MFYRFFVNIFKEFLKLLININKILGLNLLTSNNWQRKKREESY